MKHLVKVNTMPTSDEFMFTTWEGKKPYAGLTIDKEEVFYHYEGIKLPEGYVWAKDTDFEWKTEKPFNGAWHYVGNADKVAIPHIIQGKKVTSYKYMFYKTNVSGVYNDNPNVTDMSYMFKESQATTLDLTNLDTSNVTDMREMFSDSQATTLDLSKFNTSDVTDMNSMFSGSQATTLDLSSFDTSKVTDMWSMFDDSQATTLDLLSFDTSNVDDMSDMFSESKATTLVLLSFNTSNVTDMSRMFSNSQATTLDLSSFDTSNVTNMSDMFSESKATTGYARTQEDADRLNDDSTNRPSTLTFIDNVQDRYVLAKDSDFQWETRFPCNGGAWHYTGTEDKVVIPHRIKGEVVNSYRGMFYGTSVSGVYSKNPNITDMGYMFNGSQAKSLDLTYLDTSNVTDMMGMFRLSKATTLDLSKLNTNKVTDMSFMLFGSQATSLDLSGFDTSNVTNMKCMLFGSKTAKLDLSSFDTKNVTDMESMFQGSQTTILDLSKFDTTNVKNMSNMFKDSKAKRGYARTQNDADKFNVSSNKPAELTFIVKPSTNL